MAKGEKGRCENCERDKYLVARSLCAYCYAHFRRGKKEGDVGKALMEAKEHLTERRPRLIAALSKVSEGSQRIGDTLIRLETESPSKVLVLTIEFREEDVRLYDFLKNTAKKQRRSLEDQILFMLEELADASKEQEGS